MKIEAMSLVDFRMLVYLSKKQRDEWRIVAVLSKEFGVVAPNVHRSMGKMKGMGLLARSKGRVYFNDTEGYRHWAHSFAPTPKGLDLLSQIKEELR